MTLREQTLKTLREKKTLLLLKFSPYYHNCYLYPVKDKFNYLSGIYTKRHYKRIEVNGHVNSMEKYENYVFF